ncbi:arsinothricin resistance N-acetyltransferase ArsN1 family B [Modestobacter altitudinis]|uniref:arsinothricin resistance N-acetyltransferase ArsN1 family B n=1 Tax=Modestobacter altitudinis TaxID=2213158 RepID=UPI00110CF4D9|nr:arsinothricin resistance N-acetyltransferase ArsN1 family B [Modestobacter altitudinis]
MRTPAEVRPADVADAAAIAEVYRPYVTDSVASFETVAPDAGDLAQRMLSASRLPWFVACRDGAVVGYAYAARHRSREAYRWSVDCSVYLTAGERGAGTGRALYARLLPELAALGHVTAFAGIALPNPASVGLHTAVGFTPVGVYRAAGFKSGRWHDVGWWQRPLRELPPVPAEPVAWSPGTVPVSGAARPVPPTS